MTRAPRSTSPAAPGPASASRLASVVYWPLFVLVVLGVAMVLSNNWWGAAVVAVAVTGIVVARPRLSARRSQNTPDRLISFLVVISVVVTLGTTELSFGWQALGAGIAGAVISVVLSLRGRDLARFLGLGLALVAVSLAVTATGWGYALFVVIPFAVPIAAGIAKNRANRRQEPARSEGNGAN